jgi:hypothetical protein
MGPASFFTTSVAHYIVDDDGDHVLMHDHSRAPGQAQVKTKTTVSWRLDLLKDKQIADTYRAPDKGPQIGTMDEYQHRPAPGGQGVRAGRRCHTSSKRIDRLQDQ